MTQLTHTLSLIIWGSLGDTISRVTMGDYVLTPSFPFCRPLWHPADGLGLMQGMRHKSPLWYSSVYLCYLSVDLCIGIDYHLCLFYYLFMYLLSVIYLFIIYLLFIYFCLSLSEISLDTGTSWGDSTFMRMCFFWLFSDYHGFSPSKLSL